MHLDRDSPTLRSVLGEAARQVPLEDLKQGRITQSNRDKIILGRITKFRLRVTAAVLAKYPRSLSGSPLQE
jgi:hypothetical protein